MALPDPFAVPLPADLALDDDEAPFDLDLLDEVLGDTMMAQLVEAGAIPEDEIPERVQPVRRFQIDDDGLAEWAMRHVAELDQDLAVIAAQDRAWKLRIEEWRARTTRAAEARRRFFTGHLEDYQRRRRHANPKAKTLSLPSGKVTSTTTGGTAKVVDTEKVVAWFEEKFPDHFADVVKIEETIKVVEWRKVVRVVDRQIGRAFEGVLACGHEFYYAAIEEPTEEVGADVPDEPAVDLPWPCSSCPIDVLDAAPPLVLVTSVQSKPMTVRVVVDPDDEVIPGTAVEPEGLNLTVKPG